MKRQLATNLIQMASLFLGAFLVFFIQPSIAKQLLPIYGGAASVWMTCLLVFQLLLLTGYCYAHVLRVLARPKLQSIVHALVVLVSILFTVFISPAIDINTNGMPEQISVGLKLIISIGLPFIALSATSPLVQYWYGFQSDQPYRLYALSNAGSLIALLSYPVLIEPYIGLTTQLSLWHYGMFVYLGMTALTGYLMFASNVTIDEKRPASLKISSGFKWIILAAMASFMLVATTNLLTREVAPIPFLWLMPLSLYLLSFIFTFDKPDWYKRLPVLFFFSLGVLSSIYLLSADQSLSVYLQTAVYCSTLLFLCILCHGEIVVTRPQKGNLTVFYLYISTGGVLGTLIATVAAPFVLVDYFEYQIGLTVAVLLIGFMVSQSYQKYSRAIQISFAALSVLLGVTFQQIESANLSANIEEKADFRSFYGVLKILEIGTGTPAAHRRIYNDGISHGSQLIAKKYERIPNTYFSERSGVGIAINHYNKPQRRIGVIGLGAGTLAAYGRPGDNIDFFEINQDSVTAAKNHFTYIDNSPATVNIILADGRLALQEKLATGVKYDILVIDAFSGDAIPSHLLTAEAWQLYWQLLDINGLLAIHLSNKYIDLVPVVAHHNRVARSGGSQRQLVQVESEDDPSWDIMAANWLIETQSPTVLGGLREKGDVPYSNKQSRLWTDDVSSVIDLFF
jgi:hypothetical protein